MHDEYRSKECVGVEFYKAEKAETTKKTPAGTVKESLMVLQQSQLDFCRRLSVFVLCLSSSLLLSNIASRVVPHHDAYNKESKRGK